MCCSGPLLSCFSLFAPFTTLTLYGCTRICSSHCALLSLAPNSCPTRKHVRERVKVCRDGVGVVGRHQSDRHDRHFHLRHVHHLMQQAPDRRRLEEQFRLHHLEHSLGRRRVSTADRRHVQAGFMGYVNECGMNELIEDPRTEYDRGAGPKGKDRIVFLVSRDPT